MRTVPFIAGLLAALSLAVAVGDEADPAEGAKSFARVKAYEQARIEVIRKTRPATACLFPQGHRVGGGSGVIIDAEGHGLTNFHVAAAMLQDRAGEAGLPDGRTYEVEVLGVDPGGDVAMFRALGGEPFPFVVLGDSDTLSVGDYTLAMGNPFLLAEDYTPTVTLGIVSGLHRYQAGIGRDRRALRYTECIQVDTSINPGNSGGPLFDLSGRLVGINGRVSVEARGRVNVGVGYAISMNQIKRFIPMLRAGLLTQHATAGFTVTDRRRSVIVDQILEDSDAFRSGLRLGDRVLRFGDHSVRSANHFGSLLGTYPAHWPVELVYQRGEVTRTMRFRLEDLPLPRGPKGGGGLLGLDEPYEAHRVEARANRRAVARAFARYHGALAVRDVAGEVKEWDATGRRTVVNEGGGRGARPLRLVEKREEIASLSEASTMLDMERTIRWMLLRGRGDGKPAGFRVISSDEVGGRIAVVIEYRLKGKPTFRAAFDDEKGHLLRVEFEDAATGKDVRVEYDKFRGAGGLKLPHVRRFFLDDEPFAVDEFRSVTVKG